MGSVLLQLGDTTLSAPSAPILRDCELFTRNSDLARGPYPIRSSVSLKVLRHFLDAVERKPITITVENFVSLSLLCQEFGFHGLDSDLSAFRRTLPLSDSIDTDATKRIYLLEERILQSERRISQSERRISFLETKLARFVRVETEFAEMKPTPAHLKSQPPPLPSVPSQPSPQSRFSLDSLIISDFPKLFDEFRTKEFRLLWRGSRDGFNCKSFHRKCDGHANTLMVIIDTKGNIFGGFTPSTWNSKSCFTGDDSLRSFLFTLKNPHNVAPRKFALKTERKGNAIFCTRDNGPRFGPDDICVYADCQKGTTRCFGETFVNDTELVGKTILAGSESFDIKEIEIFEIVH
jgi:hypothetical protein